MSRMNATAVEQNFERVLREYGAALSRLAATYEPVAGQREDLLQDILLSIWRALPNFRGECSERTFIYRIAHNQGLTHAWRRHPAPSSLEEITTAAEPSDPHPHPEEHAARQQRKRRLMEALQSLPVGYRQIIMLLLEELSHAEIAEVLGITENNVAVRLSRARSALKTALEGPE
jgi:RNA polymerase sigma-70 factor, ECF subfamily